MTTIVASFAKAGGAADMALMIEALSCFNPTSGAFPSAR
jgi:hypothetical protein